MTTAELLKKVRQIEIKTRGMVNHVFSGEYHSVFKGRGMEFSEVREYSYGDDIRQIDWNVTARHGKPFVKIFEEERELTVMLLVDVSKSGDFGTVTATKQEIATEICAVLAFSAIRNNDKVGMILFSDTVEKFIAPKKGKSHILRLVRELLSYEPKGTGTNIGGALEYLNHVIKKRSISFVMSDFIDEEYDSALRIVGKRHDVIAVTLNDPRERELPKVGLIKMKDAETGVERWIDTSDTNVQKSFRNYWQKHEEYLRKALLSTKVDRINIEIQNPYIRPLVDFFKMRESRV
ncbi:MAG: DUF58 domain-containing protein [Ignavibacteriales bacterium]|nr:DUF58 domain-containing protein [Ignavibacteriales bacterium]